MRRIIRCLCIKSRAETVNRANIRADIQVTVGHCEPKGRSIDRHFPQQVSFLQSPGRNNIIPPNKDCVVGDDHFVVMRTRDIPELSRPVGVPVRQSRPRDHHSAIRGDRCRNGTAMYGDRFACQNLRFRDPAGLVSGAAEDVAIARQDDRGSTAAFERSIMMSVISAKDLWGYPSGGRNDV